MIEDWERVALQLYRDLGCPKSPISAFELARDCGFDVIGGLRGRARMVGDLVIQIDETVHLAAQHWQVARELGRWALYRNAACAWTDDEAADHVAAALLLPTVDFLPELTATLDPEFHACRNPCVAYELIARRMAALQDVIVTTWREGRIMRRFAPAYMDPGKPVRVERELAQRARTSSRPLFAQGDRRAYSVHEGPGGVEVLSIGPARMLIDLSDARLLHRLPAVLPSTSRG